MKEKSNVNDFFLNLNKNCNYCYLDKGDDIGF